MQHRCDKAKDNRRNPHGLIIPRCVIEFAAKPGAQKSANLMAKEYKTRQGGEIPAILGSARLILWSAVRWIATKSP